MTQPLVTIPLPEAERQALSVKWSNHPAMRHMGARADFTDPDAVRLVIDPVQPHHRGGLGTEAVNGAVIAGLLDVAVGAVGHFQAIGQRAGTAQLSIQFLRPVLGNRVTAVARLVRAGQTLVFATAHVEDEQGKVCARCEGIVAVSRAPGGLGLAV
ncbi:MAG TPA: PaaI family thioesterase [Gemmatimonadales bacterium]|nr:PaaI family thioesterase [Gemmatimonadales bacterium]